MLLAGDMVLRGVEVGGERGWRGYAEGVVLGIRPRQSRRQFRDTTGEIGEAGLIGEGARQGDLDAGDHLGDRGPRP